MKQSEQMKNGFALVWGILVLITFLVCAPILPRTVNAAKEDGESYSSLVTPPSADTAPPSTENESEDTPYAEDTLPKRTALAIPCRAGGDTVLSIDSIMSLIFADTYQSTSSLDTFAIPYSFDKEKSVLILGERAFYEEGFLLIGNELFLPEAFAVSLFSLVYDENEGGYIKGSMPNIEEGFYDPEDLRWLSAIISAEARGESFLGKIAVGNVVLNRVRSPLFPGTVKDVVFDTSGGVQFSPASSGSIYKEPTADSVLAAKVCLEGASINDSILFFYNPAISSSNYFNEKRTYIMTVGNHDFFS